ncbi:MAG TPA: hypothetical protein VF097_02320 [Actinomycetota bacterium]
MSEPPGEVRRLAEERAEARAARDFDRADALRERLVALGWEVRDAPDGYDLSPAGPAPRVPPEAVPSRLEEPPTHDLTVHWLAERWWDDVLRGVASFRRYEGDRRVEHLVVEADPAPPGTWPEGVRVLPLDRDPGFGSARAAGLRQTMGRIAIVADASVEAVGDPYAPIERALADETIGVCGPVGAVTRDLRSFEESIAPDVDAIQGYLMALRRDLLARVSFDPGYRFYRWADVDLSFEVKALGLRAVRIDVPIRRHEHRGWAALDPAERGRRSRRNHARFLRRFGERSDLLVNPPA